MIIIRLFIEERRREKCVFGKNDSYGVTVNRRLGDILSVVPLFPTRRGACHK